MFYSTCAQNVQVFTYFLASVLKPGFVSSELSSKPLRTYANILVILDFKKLRGVIKFQQASCKTYTFEANVLKTQYF